MVHSNSRRCACVSVGLQVFQDEDGAGETGGVLQGQTAQNLCEADRSTCSISGGSWAHRYPNLSCGHISLLPYILSEKSTLF